jgi:DNA-binding response OmpR family regulator
MGILRAAGKVWETIKDQPMSQPTKQFYEFGHFRLDPVERMLYRDGEVVTLSAKIFDILLVFVRNSGRTLDKEEVMREVWPDQLVEEGNLTRNVSTLRKALGESRDDHRYIVTMIHGLVSRMVGGCYSLIVVKAGCASLPARSLGGRRVRKQWAV